MMVLVSERQLSIDDFDVAAFDLDGTLLSRDLTLSEATVEALVTLRERGVKPVIATGRRFQGAYEFVEQLGFEEGDPVICYGGAMIRRLNGETLLHRTVSKSVSAEVVRWAEERGIHSRLFVDGKVIASPETPAALAHLRVFHEPDVFVADNLEWLHSGEGEEPTKLVLVDYPNAIEGWLSEAQETFAGRLFVTRSLPHYVEVGGLEGRKSLALKHLCEQWGVAPERTIAFGDAENDVDLLEFAGLGVAMGNARPHVQAAADDVTASIGEDGVARYLERLVGAA
jgi:Cof subfamily protein (haloacid dehalogenase superfamily)